MKVWERMVTVGETMMERMGLTELKTGDAPRPQGDNGVKWSQVSENSKGFTFVLIGRATRWVAV